MFGLVTINGLITVKLANFTYSEHGGKFWKLKTNAIKYGDDDSLLEVLLTTLVNSSILELVIHSRRNCCFTVGLLSDEKDLGKP